jgi:PhzF family phenazine biosynthesis protein
MDAKLFIVDAFATEAFGGNPAGVVWLGGAEFPSEDYMRRLAAELRYSETAFVRRPCEATKRLATFSGDAANPRDKLDAHKGDAFETRYFTPTDEVDLCGHATIGAFFALFKEGEITAKDLYTNTTKAGELSISVNGDNVWMKLGEPKLLGEVKDLDELYGIMKGRRVEGANAPIVSTGLPDILMPVADEAELAALSPDYAALSKLSERLDVVGVHAFTVSAKDGRVHTRNFAPRFGIDEEAATGTSNGALAYYLFSQGLVRKGDVTTFVQGEAMGRRSEILARAGEDVYVGGQAVLLARGVLCE